MRIVTLISMLMAVPGSHAQHAVLINEVQAANRSITFGPDGETPDWIELYNPGSKEVDLKDMRLSMNGRLHVIDRTLVIPPKGFQVLWCSAHPERGAEHLGSTLPRQGGAVLLIAPDRSTILDHFTWPTLGADISIGRYPDGSMDWGFFERPTPGDANRTVERITGTARTVTFDPPAGVFTDTISVVMNGGPDASIMYTLDGSPPGRDHGSRYVGAIHLSSNTVIRAKAFSPAHLPGIEQCATYMIGANLSPGITLVLDPEDLKGDTGIYAPGTQANHTRTGREWERGAFVSFPHDAEMCIPVGARISGSGSRGLAKRSFKLLSRDRYSSPKSGLPFADGSHFTEGILRADASPHAFLRNLLVEELVRQHKLSVDVQPSTPYPLYLNERYWGLYRWMPPKDAHWLRALSGSEALDILDGPSGIALNGSDDHYRSAMNTLFSDAPLDTLETLIDLQSLIDLACLDLWTGRADHDLNVRCYRPKQPGGRWRWVIFDMDLWAPAQDNSVERMCSAALPEAPFVPQILAHSGLQQRLLARICALTATVLEPDHAGALVDSLFDRNNVELLADHRRWELELDIPAPAVSLEELKTFIRDRPSHLMDHLAAYTGRSVRTLHIEGPPPELGRILLEGFPLPKGRNAVLCFSGVPLELEVVVHDGIEFAGWKGSEEESVLTRIDPSRTRVVKARFRTVVP